MYSQIITYMDKNDRRLIAVGNDLYIKQIRSACRQIIDILIIKHNQEWRDQLISLPQEELNMVLQSYMEENELLVDHPN